MFTPLARTLVALITLGTLALPLACNSQPGTRVALDDLVAPRGLSSATDGSLLIAEGGAGRLLKWDLDGDPVVLSDLYPRLPKSGIQGESASGISSAIETGEGVYHAVVGEGSAKGHSELYRLEPPGVPIPVAGQDILGSRPLPISNPYDLVEMPDNVFLVTDSGRNSVLRITDPGVRNEPDSPRGELSDYAILGPLDVPNVGEVEAVPTGATLGPDGALYVATLTGWPFPDSEAVVYRIEDTNDDGDALDEGEVTIYATGFSAATDLVFEDDGSLLVTEFSTRMAELSADLTGERAAGLPGRLVRRTMDGTIHVLDDRLVSPTSVAIVGGRIFVGEELLGRVVEVTPP